MTAGPAMNAQDFYNRSIGGEGRLVDERAAEWERTYAMFTHLALLAVHFFPVPVIPSLVMWLIKRDRSPYIDDHGREAVNFQLSLVIYALLIVPLAGLITCGVGFVLWIPVYALGIVGMILAAIAANKGQFYRYPATIRFLH
jgi:uncharacterized Tic20 family protein